MCNYSQFNMEVYFQCGLRGKWMTSDSRTTRIGKGDRVTDEGGERATRGRGDGSVLFLVSLVVNFVDDSRIERLAP